MRKMIVFAALMTSICCAAENENVIVVENADAEPAEVETVAETPSAPAAPEMNVAELILNDIDPVISSHYYVNENREVFFVEIGARFIRIKDFEKHQLVQTISKYLSEEAGTWVENADCVMEYEGQYYPAKRILTGKGICYKGAKHRQWVPMNRVRSVEHEFRIWL